MGNQGSEARLATNACLACRKVKMKCYAGDTPRSQCQRCARKSLECVYREHRRGRRPGTRLSAKVPFMDYGTDATVPGRHGRNTVSTPSSVTTRRATVNLSDVAVDDLQPSGVLNRHAMKGRFSLQDLLLSSDSDPQDAPAEPNKNHSEDPVLLGILNVAIAKSLYDSFLLVLNPFISQLDPNLHDFAYTRRKSSFLLTAVLTASAKAFHPVLYQKLYQHSQDLYTKVFRNGTKSVEVVQAILILTYWKEPRDTRVWTSVGYAIRIGMDLGWHRQRLALATGQGSTELEQREARNIERTWLVLFVYDRSLSLQTGNPFMIECDDFIQSIETWARKALGIENDRLLAALVTLRLETSAAFTFMGPRSKRSDEQSNSLGPLVSIVNRRIDTWEDHWSKSIETDEIAEEQSCHAFLIPFYGCHLRLQLSSLQLHNALSPSNLDSLWMAYSSALRMLRLIPQHSNHLGFAQDSVHVMLAYSAGFLVKLLRLAPPTISEELAPDVTAVIRAAAATVSDLAATSSSCALQTKFLDKLATQLTSEQGHRMSSGLPPGGEQRSSMFDASNVHMGELSMAPEGYIDLQFLDNGNWDEIFASVGLNVETDVLLP